VSICLYHWAEMPDRGGIEGHSLSSDQDDAVLCGYGNTEDEQVIKRELLAFCESRGWPLCEGFHVTHHPTLSRITVEVILLDAEGLPKAVPFHEDGLPHRWRRRVRSAQDQAMLDKWRADAG